MTSDKKFWLDPYFTLFRGNYLVASFIGALGVLISALGVTWAIGFHETLATSLPAYLGAFGIFWVGSWAGWSSRRVNRLLEEIRPAFSITDTEYLRFSRTWLGRLFNSRIQVGLSLFVTASAVAFITITTRTVGLPWFDPQWSSEPDLWVKNLVLMMFGVPAIFLVVTTGEAMVVYVLLIRNLMRTPVVPILETTLSHLRAITDFGLAIGAAWAVGVSLFVVFFSNWFDVTSLAGITLLTLLGFAMLGWPQFEVHRGLEHTKRQLLVSGHAALSTILGDAFDKRETATADALALAYADHRAAQVHAYIQSVASAKTWPYQAGDIASLAGTWIVPFAVIGVTSIQ